MRSRRRRLGRLVRRARRWRPSPSTLDGMRAAPGRAPRRRSRATTRASPTRTLWPLYHDVGRAAAVPPALVGRLRRVNRRFADAAAEGRRRGRRLGARLPAAAGARRCCASCGPTCASGSSCTSRSRRWSCSCSSPGAPQLVEGLLGADLVGFQLPGGAQNFLRLAARCSRPSPARSRTVESPTAAPCDVRGVPHLDRRSPSIDKLARSEAEFGDARQEIRDELGNPKHIILGVDRLDYTKGIGSRLKAYGELLEDGRSRPEHGAGAGRHARAASASRTTSSCATTSSARSAASTASSARSASPRCTTCTSPTRGTSWSRSTSPPTSCSSRRCATA